ncbi:ATP-binding protein [Gordonia amicalis]
MASIRRSAPEVLLTAKTRRWTAEEVLRTLVDAEIAARDASDIHNRLKAVGFPVTKALESFDVAASSIPANTFEYRSSMEWVQAQHNLTLIGPTGTGKSHTLIGLGIAAAHAGHKVRYFTAADLEETLYRGLADNTVGKTIDTLLRQDLLILDEMGICPTPRHRHPTAVPTRRRRLRTPLSRDRQSLALRAMGTLPAEHTTAASILDRLLHYSTIVITDGDSYRMTHRTEVPPT